MKQIATTLLSLGMVFSLCSAACTRELKPSHNVITRSQPIAGVQSIEAAGGIDVKFLPAADSAMVTITAPDNYMEYISMNVSGSVLSLKVKSNEVRLDDDAITVTVVSPSITGLIASAGADIDVLAPWSVDSTATVTLAASSGANIDLKAPLRAYAGVNISTSSGADIELKGVFASTLTADASSGSDIDLEGIEVATVTATASSGADIDLKGRATTLTANASSGADIDSRKLLTGTLLSK